MPEGASDDKVETRQHQQDLEHDHQDAAGGDEQDRTEGDASDADDDATRAFWSGDVHRPTSVAAAPRRASWLSLAGSGILPGRRRALYQLVAAEGFTPEDLYVPAMTWTTDEGPYS